MAIPEKKKPLMSLDRIDELMRAVFKELKVRGGSGSPKEVLAAVAATVKLTPTELESTEYFKSRGQTGARWDTNIRFWTTACSRAGFLIKEGGIWTLTESGEKAMKMPSGQLIRESARRYKSSRQKEPQDDEAGAVEEVESELIKQQSKTILEKAEEDARIGIDARLDELGPYQFQDLVAELLRAMGYYIRLVAPPGADGGLDILAFRDPLGIQPPHLKVQVKHRSNKMEPREVRELSGILRKETDAGLLVSSGGFTREAEREIAQSPKHMDKIDRDRLISLWTKHYDKISESGKKLLPLTPVYFLAPNEE